MKEAGLAELRTLIDAVRRNVAAPFVDAESRVRLGAVIGAEVWGRLGDRLYLRAGGEARMGGDTRGGFLFGGALTLGAGLLL